MEDKFEKKFKAYLPFIIIIAIVYLFLPCILVFTGQDKNPTFLTEIIYIGIFPLTALLCSLIYSYKNKNEFFMALIAPIIYIPSMFLYGNARDNVVTSLIYLVSYFICGFLGLILGDILRGDDKRQKQKDNRTGYQSKRKTASHVSRKAREEQNDAKERNRSINESDYSYGDNSTTAEDIDQILREIHDRQSRQ